jgi:asparagine synthase (glutamine-hydrolysing)
MMGVCGAFSRTGGDDALTMLRRMLAAADDSKRLGAVAVDAYGKPTAASVVEHDGVLIAVTGHPRLRSSRGITASGAAVAHAIAADGAAALSAMGGDFAIAAWDAKKARGFLAVDRLGVRQLFYANLGDALVFASTADCLTRIPTVDSEVSPQAVYDYLFFHVCPGPHTVYRGIRRLLPGHCLEFGEGIDAQPRPYWTMTFREEPRADFATFKEQFVELLRSAVAAAADGARCGAFLSGGTDSSTVSGMLGQTSGAPARTFSIGFDAAGYDEMYYARIAARHFGCEHHEYYVTPADVVEAAPKIAAFYDQPFGNASAVPAYYCARLASESGVDRMLAGDGGDELFGGNERYAKQQVLGWYENVPIALRKALVEPLVLRTPLFRALPLARKVYRYVEQARRPMPWRYESHNLLTHLGADRVLEPEFLAAVDLSYPQTLLGEAHAPYADCSLINQMLGIDLRFTLADSDLPKVTRMCELAGVDVAFPLLDDDVVEFSARLPAPMKLRGRHLRWFFKEALRDFLPREVIEKSKHGFGLPVGAWLTTHRPLLDLASDAVAGLRQRRIVRAGFVDELRDRLLPAHPAYYGTMIWVLMMLELWLKKKRP